MQAISGEYCKSLQHTTRISFAACPPQSHSETAMLRLSCFAILLLSILACRTSIPVLRDVDPEQREALFGPVRALEGTWILNTEGDPA